MCIPIVTVARIDHADRKKNPLSLSAVCGFAKSVGTRSAVLSKLLGGVRLFVAINLSRFDC